ncbi:MAG: ATP-binding cassette domain-containing protein [Ignavibacteriae bacterium]|nr:ATP-binding cassette domain-containing protein [Ignavibacteriota bacterium]
MFPVKFEHVSRYYGEKAAVKDATFEIEDNLITAIIGKSGSGKSTLLQMVNGLVHPSSGKVYLFGEELDYRNIIPTRLKIGYSVQGTGLFPHMNVYENIALLAKVNGHRNPAELDNRIEELMGFVNLGPGFKEKFPYQLSGGEQQRVGICRAMILNPPIFLLDEAFGALDPTTKNEIHAELLTLQENEPRCIIMVTHDLTEAKRLADKIMVIDEGEIQQYDDRDVVLNNPSNDKVKDFIMSQY